MSSLQSKTTNEGFFEKKLQKKNFALHTHSFFEIFPDMKTLFRFRIRHAPYHHFILCMPCGLKSEQRLRSGAITTPNLLENACEPTKKRHTEAICSMTPSQVETEDFFFRPSVAKNTPQKVHNHTYIFF